jgi:hypothetical protein
MANSGCHLPSGWSMLNAAPAYAAFAGVLGGFLFLGIVTLMTERRRRDTDHTTDNPANGAPARAHKTTADRSPTLMLFLPAFLCLLVSSFLFGEVSGDQVCTRGYVGGLFASSLLAVGALGVFSGISWMLDAYRESDEELRFTSIVFTYISYFIILISLLASSVDVIKDALGNTPPAYAVGPVLAYAPLLMASAIATRIWFMPTGPSRRQAYRAAVYFPVSYLVIMAVILAIMNSYGPAEWQSFNDWKVYLALGVTLFFPAVIMIVYTRSLPDVHREKAGTPATAYTDAA